MNEPLVDLPVAGDIDGTLGMNSEQPGRRESQGTRGVWSRHSTPGVVSHGLRRRRQPEIVPLTITETHPDLDSAVLSCFVSLPPSHLETSSMDPQYTRRVALET